MTKNSSARPGRKSTQSSLPPRPVRDPIPRRVLSIAVIVGGMIGIALSQLLNWTLEQGFLMTLFICGFAVGGTAMVYSMLRTRKPQ